MIILLGNLFTAWLALASAQEVDYCDPALCTNTGGKQHIACKNDGNFVEKCPKDAKMVDIAPLMPMILKEHNQHRNKLAEGKLDDYNSAARMATMQWDEELAKLAAFNVKKCECVYDGCRNSKRFKYTGQNVFYVGYTGNSSVYTDEELIQEGINKWFSEYVNGTMAGMTEYPAQIEVYGGFSHFAMMVVESNTHIGCAASRFLEDNYNVLLFTCDYATSPLRNYPVYKEGPPTSGCKTGSNKEFANLCSTEEVYEYV